MQLEVKCELQCAHKLSCVASESKCRRLHGHTYYVRVIIGGSTPKPSEVLVDVDDVRRAIMQLDHHYLNERLPELKFEGESTLENLVFVVESLVERILPGRACVVFVEVQEGSGGKACKGTPY